MAGKLYVVGTPIGNLEDFTPRAKRILETVDFIAAEDTRVTLKLLNHFDIKKELISYYEHNKKEKGEQIIYRLQNGESCAIVTDAGMPCISDPGEDLVNLAYENEIMVESVPGPCALITALAVSGMPGRRFFFEGFLPVQKAERRERLKEISTITETLILYEAPHKFLATLNDLKEAFGEREIALAKELTKIHETVFKTTLTGAIDFYKENAPKGEFVLIISGAKPQEKREYTFSEAVALAEEYVSNGDSASAAAKRAAEITGIKKGEIYRVITANRN